MRKVRFAVCMILIIVLLGACRTTKNEDKGGSQIGYQLEYESTEENGVVHYHVDNQSYTYLLRLSGRSKNAAYDSYYVVLTNDEHITFQDVDERFWESSLPSEESFRIIEYGMITE